MVLLNRERMDKENPGSYGSAVANLSADIVVDACCYEDYHCQHLIDKLRHSKPLRHFLHCGSLRVYNPLLPGRPWKENGPRGEPCGYLTLQQQKMETRLMELHKTAGFPATVLLLGELVGEGWCPLTFQGLYDPACFVALKTNKWVMMPKQQAFIQVLDVRDAVDAVCAMLAKPEALGESWNLCGDALGLKDYMFGVAKINGWEEPEMRERTWLDFSYAIDKMSLHLEAETWKAPEASDSLWRLIYASPNKVVKTFGCSFRSPVQALADAAKWTADHAYVAARPRLPMAHLIRGDGRLPPFLPSPKYAGPREGYIYKCGRDGSGYYIDLGPYVDWQQACILLLICRMHVSLISALMWIGSRQHGDGSRTRM